MSDSIDALLDAESLIAHTREALKYERDALLFADAEMRVPVEDQKSWEGVRRIWNKGATQRRTDAVLRIAGKAIDRALGYDPASREGAPPAYRRAPMPADGDPEEIKVGRRRIKGFEQIYELLEQKANLTGLETAGRRIAAAISEGLAPTPYGDEVSSAAAVVGWKMAERSEFFVRALMGARAPELCVALLQHATARMADKRTGRSNAKKNAARREEWVTALYTQAMKERKGVSKAGGLLAKARAAPAVDGGALFCTKLALGGAYNVIGLLDALSLRDSHAAHIQCDCATPYLLSVATRWDAEASESSIAASTLCTILALSKPARAHLLSKPRAFPDIGGLLFSSSTNMNLLGVSIIGALVREKWSRKQIPADQAADCFGTLMTLVKWCADEIKPLALHKEPSTSTRSTGGKTIELLRREASERVHNREHIMSNMRDEAADENRSQTSVASDDSSIARSQLTGARKSLFAASANSTGSTSQKVHHLLGQACMAAWGCAAALIEKGAEELNRLYAPPIASWLTSENDNVGPPPPSPPSVVVSRRRSLVPVAAAAPGDDNLSSLHSRSEASDSDDDASEIPEFEGEERQPRAEMGDESWIELLVRVAGMETSIEDHFTFEAAAGALAVALSGPGGCDAIAGAAKVPGMILDSLCCLIESSGNLKVRVCAAGALARGSEKPSRALNAFYTGCMIVVNKKAGRRTRGTITGTMTGNKSKDVMELANACADDHVLKTTILQHAGTGVFKVRGDARVVAVINEEIGSRALEAATSAILLNLALNACPTAPRGHGVLEAHVSMINCDCFGDKSHGMLRGVLRRGCLAVWALARTRTNRRKLNDVNAAGALTATLGGGASLATKESALAALWLLACDELGAVKVALAKPPVGKDVAAFRTTVTTKSNSTKSSADDSTASTIASAASIAKSFEAPPAAPAPAPAPPADAAKGDAKDDGGPGPEVPELPELKISRPPQASLHPLSTIPMAVGIISFDSNTAGYATIRMLAMGLIHKLIMSSDDLLRVIASYAPDLAAGILNTAHDPIPHILSQHDHLAGEHKYGKHRERRGVVSAIGRDDVLGIANRIVHDDGSASSESIATLAPAASKRLQILAVETCFRLAECDEGARAVARSRGVKALESLCATLLVHPRYYALRTIGAFRAAKLAQSPQCRRQLVACEAIPLLVANFQDSNAPASLRIYALHALLNMSGEARIQPKLCKHALTPLLRISRVADDVPLTGPVARTHVDDDGNVVDWDHTVHGRVDDARSEVTSFDRQTMLRVGLEEERGADRDLDLEARYAQSILANLSKNVTCRARMYQRHLKHASRALKRTIRVGATIRPSDSISTANNIVDDRTLVDFFANAKDHNFVSEKMAKRYNQIVAIHAAGPTPAQLNRLRRNFHDPVARLWEEPPLDLDAPGPVDILRLDHDDDDGEWGPETVVSGLDDASLPNVLDDYGRPSTTGVGSRSAALSPAEASRSAPAPGGRRPSTAPQFSQRVSLLTHSPLFPASQSVLSTPVTRGRERTNAPRASAKHGRTNASLRAETRPRSPLRSSHRVGPLVGGGAPAMPGGENRWEPRVLNYSRDARQEDDGEAMAVRFSPRVLELEPNVPYHKITFHAPPRRKKGRLSSVTDAPPCRLIKFKHSPGAKTYSSLFPTYTLALDPAEETKARDDYAEEAAADAAAGIIKRRSSRKEKKKDLVEHCYFYYTTNVVCEAIDPGPARMPDPPGTIELLMRPIPAPPPVDVPDLDTQPLTYRSSAKNAPDIKRHALVVCAMTGAYGGIPAAPLPVYCRMVDPPPPEPEPKEDVESEGPPPWDVSQSVFNARLAEADSRAFFETPKVFKRAVQCDFNRLCEEDRFARFVGKMDESVATAGDSLDEEMMEVKESFSQRYPVVMRIFDYYCACSSSTTKSAFSISENNFIRFVQDCGISDDSTACTAAECSKIFIVCNFESDKATATSDANDDRALMRFEFMECLVRMSVARFRHETNDVSECLDRLFDEIILPTIDPHAVLDPDIFRREKLYFEDVEVMIKPHVKYLKLVYLKYSMLNPAQGKAKFGLMEWDALVKDCHLVSDDLTSREVRLSFWWSRMVVVDEVKQRMKFMTLSWTEFLEALGRMAEMMTLPSDEVCAMVGASNIVDYYIKFEVAPASVQTEIKRAIEKEEQEAGEGWPLHHRFERLIKLLMGRLAIVFKGYLQAGNKRLNLKDVYITEEQLTEIAY